MRTRIARLVEVAATHPTGTATASNGKWWATRIDDSHAVVVGHHLTKMMTVDYERRVVIPVSPGWGSQTDKCGIGAILDYEKDLTRPSCDEPSRSYHHLYYG